MMKMQPSDRQGGEIRPACFSDTPTAADDTPCYTVPKPEYPFVTVYIEPIPDSLLYMMSRYPVISPVGLVFLLQSYCEGNLPKYRYAIRPIFDGSLPRFVPNRVFHKI